MKPFYRMLTHTVLVLQFIIIVYLLCPHRKDNGLSTESCRSNRAHSAMPAGALGNTAKAECKNVAWKDRYVLWK
jgi:hypothetical protein